MYLKLWKCAGPVPLENQKPKTRGLEGVWYKRTHEYAGYSLVPFEALMRVTLFVVDRIPLRLSSVCACSTYVCLWEWVWVQVWCILFHVHIVEFIRLHIIRIGITHCLLLWRLANVGIVLQRFRVHSIEKNKLYTCVRHCVSSRFQHGAAAAICRSPALIDKSTRSRHNYHACVCMCACLASLWYWYGFIRLEMSRAQSMRQVSVHLSFEEVAISDVSIQKSEGRSRARVRCTPVVLVPWFLTWLAPDFPSSRVDLNWF